MTHPKLKIVTVTHRPVIDKCTGHRAYIDNPRLVVTRQHRAPVPRGHRSWLDPLVWRQSIDGERA